jgi:hypothetical protein
MNEARRGLQTLIACAVLCCATACGESSDVPTTVTGTIQGTVTDVLTGAPLPDATVRIGEAGALTGADGTYLLHGVPQGGLTLTVDRSDYWQYNGWVVFVAANGVLVRDIALTPKVGS